MKKILAFLLSICLIMSGCASSGTKAQETAEKTESIETEYVQEAAVISDTIEAQDLNFNGLDDEQLLTYVEDAVYQELVAELDSDEYFVENVKAIYISKEYLEEIAYNSQENIYFGYTLSELDELFQGSRYIFTLGEDGQTDVQEFVEIEDDSYDQVLKNVAIGTGVILLCVTVSSVTGGLGAPAVSMIFAASAKTATVFALSSGTLSGVSAAMVRGYQTHDFSEALKAGIVTGSENFKWGAISGALMGGATESIKYAKAMKALKGVELSKDITMQQAAAIQMESSYPVEVIKQFHTMQEYQVFKDAGLKAAMINGKTALIRSNIDLNSVDEFGRSNLKRMSLGYAPLDANGAAYELHHIGQEADATLAILTQVEHDNAVLHGFKTTTEINRNVFATQRKKFWKTMAKILSEGAI